MRVRNSPNGISARSSGQPARSREWVKSNGRHGIPTVKLGRYYRYRLDAIAEYEAQLERGEAEA